MPVITAVSAAAAVTVLYYW